MANSAHLPWAVVCLASQRLFLYDAQGVCQRIYPVSTARRGPGQQQGSGQTPLGRHRIRAIIGRGLPLGTVFRGRRPTGEQVPIAEGRVVTPLPSHLAKGDAITTRILWLCGEEVGWNRLGRVDSQRRFIYLHGTADETHLGQAVSHGCIRLANGAIAELAMLLPAGSRLWILTYWPLTRNRS